MSRIPEVEWMSDNCDGESIPSTSCMSDDWVGVGIGVIISIVGDEYYAGIS